MSQESLKLNDPGPNITYPQAYRAWFKYNNLNNLTRAGIVT